MGKGDRQAYPAPVIIISVMLVCATSCGLIGISTGKEARRLDYAGITTEAVVIIAARPGKGGPGPVVSFDTQDGERVEVICDSCADELKAGTKVSIRYDPADLDMHVEQVGRVSHRRVSIATSIAAGLFTLGALILAGRSLARRLLRK
ncbi:DUF3592 domain-containing protein [Micromonospora carbonacea]|uniref:DUF3592 domain-containing protein n=1 Tax=Micromonospora carbonacea TaxID=47853 RepID=UPI00371D888A